MVQKLTPFRVSLQLYLTGNSTRAMVRGSLNRLTREEPLMDGAGSLWGKNDSMYFSSQAWRTQDTLLERVQSRSRDSKLVVISDRLATRRPTELVSRLRRSCTEEGAPLLGTVAVVDTPPQQIHSLPDIDVTCNPEGQPERLREAIVRVANALWLKSPFRHQATAEDSYAVKVRLVRSRAELSECLHLRFRIYSALRYLEEAVASNESELELDSFDRHALHLCAVDYRSGEVIGTLRLVLPAFRKQDRRRTPSERLNLDEASTLREVIEHQGEWAEELSEKETILHRKLRSYNAMTPLPIYESTDFGAQWPHFLKTHDFRKSAEISRLVVAPRYRGMGISKLLMRAVFALSMQLQLRFLLLECVPNHVGMYQAYGFQPRPNYHCRHRDLDQIAVAMELDLDDFVGRQAAIGAAHRDLRLLRAGPGELLLGKRGLCLCRLTDCWKRALYKKWGTKACCYGKMDQK